MITLNSFLDRIQRKLDDEKGEVWSRDFLARAAQDGSDRLSRESQCIFDMDMTDNRPLTGDHTRDFEADYMTGPILGRFNYTRESEREFVSENSLGPVNHTRPTDAEYMTDPEEGPTVRSLVRLSSRFVAIDRVTHDWLRLEPEHDRYLRLSKTEYQSLQGGVYSYSMDQDGIFWLRTVGVPVMRLPSEEVSGIYGAVRQISSYSFDQELVLGEYGVIRQVPRHFATGNQYGVIRRIVPDDRATRVEYFRLAKPLSEGHFELPDRVVRYIEWWVMHRAYSEPGEGENKDLASHFKNRYQNGVMALKKRINAVNRERTIAMGSKRHSHRDSYLEMFPADYGYKRPFRA